MKTKISVTLGSEILEKTKEKLEEGLFRNRSHIIEYALKNISKGGKNMIAFKRTIKDQEKSKPIRIAIFGSAKKHDERTTWNRIKDRLAGEPRPTDVLTSKEYHAAVNLGTVLGEVFGNKVELITGACRGVPDIVAEHARKRGVTVVGYSGETNQQDHETKENYVDPSRLDEVRFLDEGERITNGLCERSMAMIRDADAYVFLGGRTGTLGEYAMAFDGSNKPMYVHAGAGGPLSRLPILGINKQRSGGQPIRSHRSTSIVDAINKEFNIDPHVVFINKTGDLHGAYRSQADRITATPSPQRVFYY